MSDPGLIKTEFEAYLVEHHLDEYDNETIARRLSTQEIHIPGPYVRNVRHGKTLANRSLWKLWVVTGRELDSLKPEFYTPLLEWMFAHDLNDSQLAEKAGMGKGSVASYLYQGVKPRGQNRQKLWALTQLADFASEDGEPIPQSRVEDTESSPAPDLPLSPPTNVVEEASIVSFLHLIQAIALGEKPEGLDEPELIARMLESTAAVVRSRPRQRVINVTPEPVNEVEEFAQLLKRLEQLLRYFAKQDLSVRVELRNQVPGDTMVRLGSWLVALLNETNFQGWLASGRISI